MDKRILGVMIVSVVLSMAFFIVSEDSSDSDAGESIESVTTLHGFVYDIPAEKNREPIEGVTVITWDEYNNRLGSDVTKANGSFDVPFSMNVYYLSFELEGFTVQGTCSELHSYGDTNLYRVVLSDYSETDGVHNLYDQNGFTALISRTSASIFGSITTVINGDSKPIEKAEVTLTTSKTTLTAKTDSNGNFNIVVSSEVAYQITVKASGFVEWTRENVQASDEPLAISLEQKDHSVLFGMDLSHTVAVFGVLIMVLVILVFIYLSKRPEKMDGLYVVNDLSPREEKKKDD